MQFQWQHLACLAFVFALLQILGGLTLPVAALHTACCWHSCAPACTTAGCCWCWGPQPPPLQGEARCLLLQDAPCLFAASSHLTALCRKHAEIARTAVVAVVS